MIALLAAAWDRLLNLCDPDRIVCRFANDTDEGDL